MQEAELLPTVFQKTVELTFWYWKPVQRKLLLFFSGRLLANLTLNCSNRGRPELEIPYLIRQALAEPALDWNTTYIPCVEAIAQQSLSANIFLLQAARP